MIGACVESCLKQTRQPDQILVINDGSTDRTKAILNTFGAAITTVTIPTATGNKSRAQEIALHFVTGDIFIATDADTILDRNFVAHVERAFLHQPGLAAVAGYVSSTANNWLTALREIEYVLGQDVYKNAQAAVNFIMVIPGCAGAFRTELFTEHIITFEHDTLTEDLDFTYKLHRQHLPIAYVPEAIVYTQDPNTIHSYINQMRRWYGGGWQNILKHYNMLYHSPGSALQMSMSYIETVSFALIFFILPFVNPSFFFILLGILVTTSLLAGGYAAWRRQRIDLFLYSPLLIVMRALNSWVFLEQFWLEIIRHRHTMTWFQPARRIIDKKSV